MSADERMKNLGVAVDRAVERASELDQSVWPDSESRKRIEDVLAYAQLVIERSDGTLVSQAAGANVEATLVELVNAPEQIAVESEAWVERFLDYLVRFPVAQGRELEQSAKAAAKSFQRSAQRRLSTIDNEVRSTKEEIDRLRVELEVMGSEAETTLNARAAEGRQTISELETGFRERLQTYESTLETEREESIKQRGDQAQAFAEAESKRTAQFQGQLDIAKADIDLLESQSKEQVETLVGEIQRMRDQSAELVGVIGTIGTGDRYGKEATAQKKIADIWRLVTVGFGLSAIGGVLAAILENHPATETYAGKIALSLVLGGVATYAANQSKNHRDREKHARNLQLELTAFSPFIEPLTTEQQEEERVRMTRRTFGQIPALDDSPELGPTPLSLLLQRKKKEEGEE